MTKQPNFFVPALIENGKGSVPRAAMNFAGSFAAGDEQPATDSKPATIPVTIRARSGDVVNHWFWGRCVHDLEGFTPASAKLPLDYCHDDREALGFSDSQEAVGTDLVLHGVLIPHKEQDRVDEIVTKAAAGFEWQASITFDPETAVIEVVPEGYASPVNGGTFEGPGVIFREWPLRGAAICPYGYDPNTSVQFSNQGNDVAVTFMEPTMATKPAAVAPNRHDRRRAASLARQNKPEAAPKPGALAKPAGKPAKSAGKFGAEEEKPEEMEAEATTTEGEEADPEKDCDCPEGEECDCDEQEDTTAEAEAAELEAEPEKTAELSAVRKEARRFVHQFGAKLGGKWFAEGLTFGQAQAQFNKTLAAENATLRKKNADQAAQLSALMGEDEPATFTSAEGKPAPKRASKFVGHLPSGAAKFAASLKLPK